MGAAARAAARAALSWAAAPRHNNSRVTPVGHYPHPPRSAHTLQQQQAGAAASEPSHQIEAVVTLSNLAENPEHTLQQQQAGPEPLHVIEAVVTLSNLAENPETHAVAFDGARGEAAFALFVNLLQALMLLLLL